MAALHKSILVTTGVAVCLALAACTNSENGDGEARTATATASVQAEPSPSATPLAGETSDPAAVEKLQAAGATSQSLAEADGFTAVVAMTQEMLGTATSSCASTVMQPASGAVPAIMEMVQMMTTEPTDLDAICETGSPFLHYFVSGTDGYIEYPVGSGSYIKAELDPALAEVMGANSSAAWDIEAQLGAATITENADGTIALAIDSVEDLASAVKDNKGLAGLGLDPSMLSQLDEMSMQATYLLDQATGAFGTIEISTTASAAGLEVDQQMHMGYQWGVDTPIATPSTISGGAPVKIGTMEELVQVAMFGQTGPAPA